MTFVFTMLGLFAVIVLVVFMAGVLFGCVLNDWRKPRRRMLDQRHEPVRNDLSEGGGL